MRRLARLLPALLAAAALAACGTDDEQPASPAPADSTHLTVEVTRAASQPIRMELRCGGARPCRQLDKLTAALRKPEGPATACTLQYGGPEQAHVTGTLQGRPVEATLTRADGCGIADYATLFTAFGRQPPLAG
jgi:hypothetical protein